MKNLYFLLLVLFASAGCDIEGVLGDNGSSPELTPEGLLLEIIDDRRFVSVDEVADWIINQDPSVTLVDVRSQDEFDHFSLPGAVNVPLSDLLAESAETQLDCDRRSLIFFSTGSIVAEQAWMLYRRKGCLNNYVMEGGLNAWGDKIIQPEKPAETASSEEWDLYNFRIAARKYFLGASTELEPEPYVEPAKPKAATTAAPAKKEVKVKPKKKLPVFEEEEGC